MLKLPKNPKDFTQSFKLDHNPEKIHGVLKKYQNRPESTIERREFLKGIQKFAIAEAVLAAFSPEVSAQILGNVLGLKGINGKPISGSTPPPDPPPDPPDPEGFENLRFSDLYLKGYIGFPSSGTLPATGCPRGACIRKVNGKYRYMMMGNPGTGALNTPVLEYEEPAGTVPSLTVASAPRLTFIANHGTIGNPQYNPYSIEFDMPKIHATDRMIQWDEDKQVFHTTWRWNYVQTIPGRSICMFGADPVTKAPIFTQRYGSYRMMDDANKEIMYSAYIPSDWQPYFGNSRWFLWGDMHSGVNTASFGPNLWSLNDDTFDIFTTPTNPNPLIPVKKLHFHDKELPKAINTNWRGCDWPGGSHGPTIDGVTYKGYDCAYPRQATAPYNSLNVNNGRETYDSDNSSLNSIYRNWKTKDSTKAEGNNMECVIPVDLPDKKGIIHLGFLTGSPTGYVPLNELGNPSDPDNLSHMWYADPVHASGAAYIRPNGFFNSDAINGSYNNTRCCHGQASAGKWQSTGPAAHFYVQCMWVYGLLDYINSYAGDLNFNSFIPLDDEKYIRGIAESSPGSLLNGAQFHKGNKQVTSGGAYVDVDAREIRIILHQESTTNNGVNPVVVVWGIT